MLCHFLLYSIVNQLYIYIYVLFFRVYSHVGHQSTEQGALCQTVSSYQLSVLYIAVCICQSQSPNLSILPSQGIVIFFFFYPCTAILVVSERKQRLRCTVFFFFYLEAFLSALGLPSVCSLGAVNIESYLSYWLLSALDPAQCLTCNRLLVNRAEGQNAHQAIFFPLFQIILLFT